MDLLTALKSRTSSPRLGGEVPSDEALENLFLAASRAPDHAQLRPCRFLRIEGEGRHHLGGLFVQAKLIDKPELTPLEIEKIGAKPLRAPLIIVAIANIQEHPKVPEVEQILSVGAAVQNLILAAYAQDIGAMWRTGDMAFNSTVKDGLGLKVNEQIVGFVYIGTQEGKSKNLNPVDTQRYVQQWPKK